MTFNLYNFFIFIVMSMPIVGIDRANDFMSESYIRLRSKIYPHMFSGCCKKRNFQNVQEKIPKSKLKMSLTWLLLNFFEV